jgi:cytochrome c peroxidase
VTAVATTRVNVAYKYACLHPQTLVRIVMSFSLLRAPIRRAAVSATAPRAAFRSSYRRFSSDAPPPPKSSSNTTLYTSLGVIALTAGAYYYYTLSIGGADAATAAKSAVQSAKAAAKFTPSKEDYQKAL